VENSDGRTAGYSYLKYRPRGDTLQMTANIPKQFFLKVEESKCQGHNRCYLICPELFDVDDYGTAKVIITGSIPEHLMGKAELAVQNCPELAISITEGLYSND
jgi:ferredoxin